MQSTISLRSASERESRLRRSAILTALYGLGIIAALIAGLWLMLAFTLPEAFYGSIAIAALLSDPLRRNLHQIID
ncbi:MAG: hypothetical protein HDS64_08635 [Bacteroidales bacterium]|nr:hypothetical protein [Bacteroidales bacterium]MBD5282435.1 hypothetical protein [Bacteroides sp.]MDE6033230.1 hypothetical protein [Muribaculaceae bacterium]